MLFAIAEHPNNAGLLCGGCRPVLPANEIVPLSRRTPRPPPTAHSTRRVRGRDEGVAGAEVHQDETVSPTNGAREGAPNQYDALGNLLGVWLPNGDVVEYLVDGLGRRVGKKLNGVVTRQWLYRDGLKPVAELNGAGTLQKQFVYGSHPLVPEFVVAGANVYRVMSDQLGSPRVLIDVATGTVQQQMRHSAFGEALEDTNPGFTPFGFAGGIYDADTGLVRFGGIALRRAGRCVV
jgi:YD repeat-containing protein